MTTQRVEPYDAVHVDGGHTYEVAYADIMNSCKLLRDDGLILVDDLPAEEVKRAVDAALETGLVETNELNERFSGSFQAYLQKSKRSDSMA